LTIQIESILITSAI